MAMRDTEEKGNILVVDDMPANLEVLKSLLEAEGHIVRLVPSGIMALKSATAIPPDLILLDVNMPGMTGYEVCQELKIDPQLRDIPVVFISALTELDDKIVGYAVGGNDYITKPFDCEEVLVRVKVQLKINRLKRNLAKVSEENERFTQILEQLKTLLGEDIPLSVSLLSKMTANLLNKECGAVSNEQAERLKEMKNIESRLLKQLNDVSELIKEPENRP
jgi:CheY-like chemotaxis protein